MAWGKNHGTHFCVPTPKCFVKRALKSILGRYQITLFGASAPKCFVKGALQQKKKNIEAHRLRRLFFNSKINKKNKPLVFFSYYLPSFFVLFLSLLSHHLLLFKLCFFSYLITIYSSYLVSFYYVDRF